MLTEPQSRETKLSADYGKHLCHPQPAPTLFSVLIRVYLWLIVQIKSNLRVFGIQDRMKRLAIVCDDLVDIVLRLPVRRHALILVDSSFARVVTGERQLHIAFKSLQEPGKVFGARGD